MELSPVLRKKILITQQKEITEHFVYERLAKISKEEKNKEVLKKLAGDELRHYNFWKTVSNEEIKASKSKIFFYICITRILGLTFGLRLMEEGEELSQENYKKLQSHFPEVEKIIKDEEEHEQALIGILNIKKLEYAGSIILGLNDALVELTGALAGLTLALNNTKLIATVGMITGIAASMSMAASQYLSKKEEGEKNALSFSLYTGIAYIITVSILITPFLLMKDHNYAMATTLVFALLVIFLFTFYSAVAKHLSFKKKFFEMATISLGVAILNFGIGYLVKKYIGVS